MAPKGVSIICIYSSSLQPEGQERGVLSISYKPRRRTLTDLRLDEATQTFAGASVPCEFPPWGFFTLRHLIPSTAKKATTPDATEI